MADFGLTVQALATLHTDYALSSGTLARLWNSLGGRLPDTRENVEALALVAGCLQSLGAAEAIQMFVCQNSIKHIARLAKGEDVTLCLADRSQLGWGRGEKRWLNINTLEYEKELSASPSESLLVSLTLKRERLREITKGMWPKDDENNA